MKAISKSYNISLRIYFFVRTIGNKTSCSLPPSLYHISARVADNVQQQRAHSSETLQNSDESCI